MSISLILISITIACVTIFMFTTQNVKKHYVSKIIAHLLYMSQGFIINAVPVILTAIIGILKNTTYIFIDTNKTKTYRYINLSVWLIVYLISGIISFDGVSSVIPLFCGAIGTYCGWTGKLNLIRFTTFFTNVLYIIYYIIYGVYASIPLACIEIGACIVGIAREKKMKKVEEKVVS